MAKKVAVLGAGSWGSVLASLLDENGSDVKLWSYNPQQVKELNEEHTNTKYIKNFTFADSLVATNDLGMQLMALTTFIRRSNPSYPISCLWLQILADRNKTLILSMRQKELKKKPTWCLKFGSEIDPKNRKSISVLSGQIGPKTW